MISPRVGERSGEGRGRHSDEREAVAVKLGLLTPDTLSEDVGGTCSPVAARKRRWTSNGHLAHSAITDRVHEATRKTEYTDVSVRGIKPSPAGADADSSTEDLIRGIMIGYG